MTAAAIITLVFVLGLTIWAALRTGPDTLSQLGEIWNTDPWPKQVVGDFYGLEVILALWMLQHAALHETWWILIPCLATMPVLGATPAAAYWLLAVTPNL
jgi:hypothetical protein